MITTFSSSFITTNQTAFEELVAMGSEIAQRSLLGKQSKEIAQRNESLFETLEAYDCAELTAKEYEALEYQITGLLESQFTPTINPLYSV